jgi:hypothetical protein
MTHTTRIGRLAGLAVGLGIGAALAANPGIASADPLDFQISIDGYDLIPTADTTATAYSGTDDIAIAIGTGSMACAGSTAAVCGGETSAGQFDSAFADGTGSAAVSEGGNFDSSFATGAGSGAGTGTGNYDTAFANGTDSFAGAGGDTVTDSAGTTVYPGNDDFAYVLGPHSIAESGGLLSQIDSSNDIAMVVDPFGTDGSTAYAGEGNSDLAAAFGDMLHAMAVEGSNIVQILP